MQQAAASYKMAALGLQLSASAKFKGPATGRQAKKESL